MIEMLAIGAIGSLLGASAILLRQKIKLQGIKQLSQELLAKAEEEAAALRHKEALAMKTKQLEQHAEFDRHCQKEHHKLHVEQERLKKREDATETRLNAVEKKLLLVEQKEKKLSEQQSLLSSETAALSTQKELLNSELEKISGVTAKEAKELLLQKLSIDMKEETTNYIRKQKKEAEEEAEMEARKIISTAIGRLAVPCASETTINIVNTPNEEMKGRVIGREGRNIRTFEKATGITCIIDETPNTIVLSGFDPLRLHIARTALNELITDGRIHPTRIEEVVENVRNQTAKLIKTHGEDAALRIGAFNLHPEIINLLGKLKFRHSYSQNILEHSLEVSYLMGIMAAELGLDERLAKRIGLLHDMGKAVSHEMEGTHAIIGYNLALKYGESLEVANGIGCHHQEMDPITIEGSLCAAADAISASRPGARGEAVAEYIKRLERLEKIAYEFPGIEKAYALQAGRELRIFVLPDMIDDNGTLNLARDLSKRIEKELSYPGKIKISVTREKRIVEYAG